MYDHEKECAETLAANDRLKELFGLSVWVWRNDDRYYHENEGGRSFHVGGYASPMFKSWEAAFSFATENKMTILAEVAQLQAAAEASRRVAREQQEALDAEQAAHREAERQAMNRAAIERVRGAVEEAHEILRTLKPLQSDQEATVRLAIVILNTTRGAL